jgi:hypothetical protein
MILKRILFILASLIVLLFAFVLFKTYTFKQQAQAETLKLFESRKQTAAAVVTEEDINKLPPPIQRYLRHSNVVGKPKVQTVRLKQKGFFRPKPDQKWMPLEAEQYYTTNPPGFLWFAKIYAIPFIPMNARDLYMNGQGNMHGRILSTIPIIDASGPELNQGAMVRYLNEIVWFPTAWLSDYLSWEPINSTSAKVTMNYGGISASAIVYINEAGDIMNFTAERYMMDGETYKMGKWSTPATGYGEFNGIRIPTKGKAQWHLESGEYAYIDVEIVALEYNKPLLY